jgi:hypothetical protein
MLPQKMYPFSVLKAVHYDLSNDAIVIAVTGFHHGQLNNLNFTIFSTKHFFDCFRIKKGVPREINYS